MARAEQSVLIVGDDPAQVDRLLPMLRRSHLSVRRAVGTAEGVARVHREASDLIVVALAMPGAADVLRAVRARGSLNEHAALLAILETQQPTPGAPDPLALANRVLSPEGSPVELQQTVATLLDVAPRAEVRAPIRLRLGLQEPDSPFYEVHNLSTSGVFVKGADHLPVGSTFGFELKLPDDHQPILGKAQVVRHGDPQREGMTGLGASFLAIGGEGPERLRQLVDRRAREAEEPGRQTTTGASPATTPPSVQGSPSGHVPIQSAQEIAHRRVELEEISTYLDELLRKGLHRRFEVADWYVTGAELGLESLRTFYRILEEVYRGASSSPQAERRLADLRTVHAALTEFAKQEQDVENRVRIMLEIRRPLERLLFELGETGRSGQRGNHAVAHEGMVSQLSADVGALLRLRGSLVGLRQALAEVSRLRYVFARRARRRRVAEIRQRFGKIDWILGSEASLRRHRGLRVASDTASREIARLDDRVKAIHDRIYQGRFLPLSSGNPRADLGKETLLPVLSDVLVQGYEYLLRAYTAYRDALEVIGSDPGLLERAGRLAAIVETGERDRAVAPAAP